MTTRDIVYIALFAALSAAMAIFPPIPMFSGAGPIVVQSIAPLLAGSIIGAWRGALSQLLFVILIAVGLPLLSGGRGGLGPLLAPAGGFVLSWIVVAGVVGHLLAYRHTPSIFYRIGCNLVGAMLISYPIGLLWLIMVSQLSLSQALIGIVIFMPGDLLKVVAAAYIGHTVQRAYPLIER